MTNIQNTYIQISGVKAKPSLLFLISITANLTYLLSLQIMEKDFLSFSQCNQVKCIVFSLTNRFSWPRSKKDNTIDTWLVFSILCFTNCSAIRLSSCKIKLLAFIIG